jgi:hypothetical protein
MKLFGWLDPVWLIWGLWFVIWEGRALINKSTGDTLSENVWNWLRGKRQRVNNFPDPPIKWNHNTWRTWFLFMFLIWLAFHLSFGWGAG